MFRFSRLLPLLPVLLILSACQSGGTEPIPTLPDSSFQIDTSFGGVGYVTTTLDNGNDTALGVAIQSDGKIVTAGSGSNGLNSDIAVVRYNSDGTLDTGFNVTGVVKTDINSTNQAAYAVALQSTGEIVVAGYSYNTTTALNNFVVVRYTTTGALDATFNAAGNAYDTAGVATAGVNPAGVVTVAAGTGSSVARALVIQGNGMIVVAGSASNTANDDIAVVRLDSNGALDTGFNTTGIVTVEVNTAYSAGTPANDTANAVGQQPIDDKIVVAGTSNNAAVVVRFNTNGSLDSGFGTNGITLIPSLTAGNALVIQADRKSVVGGVAPGDANDMAVARLDTSGALDPTFNATGSVPGVATVGFLAGRNDTVTSLALQSGKIVAAGAAASGIGYDFAVVRFINDGVNDGALDTGFGLGGKASTPIGFSNDAINAIAIQSDNRIVAAGGSWLNNRWIIALARYLP